MNSPLTARLVALLVAVTAALVPVLAPAQMIPISDSRVVSVEVHAFGLSESVIKHPPVPWAFFQTFEEAYVENPDIEEGGHCLADAFQTSQFFPAGIQISGTTAGGRGIGWDGDTDAGTRAPAGIYFLRAEAGSIRESRKIVLVR